MVGPLNDLLHKGLSERAFNECVLDGVFISTIQTFVVRLDSRSEQFFVCYYNSMDEFKLKLFEVSVLADVLQRLENLAPSIPIY